MTDSRLAGIVISIVFAIIFFAGRRKRSYGETATAVLIIGGILLVSLRPETANFLRDLLQLDNRLFAVLVASNLLLFGLFFYTLRLNEKNQSDIAHLIRMIARTDYQRSHSGLKESKVLVVIPAYKEEDNIASVLQTLPDEILGVSLEPIVIVDGNYDRTERIVKEMGHRVATHITNRGQGGALITGFEIAIAEGADVVVTMDADGQHRIEDLPLLLTPIFEDQADYVMGSRFYGEYEDKGGARHLGIVLFSNLISMLTATRISDVTNGYRAIRVSKLVNMHLTEERFNAPELIIQAARNGLRIQQVPVTILSRAEGESKKPARLGYPIGFGMAMLRAWLR